VLLGGAGLVAALGVGERVLRAIREIHVPTADGEARIRASAGLASTEEGILDADELLTRATAALGAARRAGGDRPAVWEADAQPVAQARKHAC
jgi:GGDEF domain-containing protein